MTSLFSKDYKEINTSAELGLLVKKTGLDPLFLAISCSKFHFKIKNDLEKWFQKINIFLDRDFSKEIKRKCHQRLWELYCGKLADEKFGIQEKNKKKGTPEFKCFHKEKIIWIEAVAPENGLDSNKIKLVRDELKEREFVSRGGPISDVVDPVVLRAQSSAINQKYEKYIKTYLKNGVSPDDGFIIALNTHLFDDGMLDEQTIRQLFFGMGNQVILFNKSKDIPMPKNRVLVEDRKKSCSLSGVKIETGIFLTDKYKYISGVFFTSKGVVNLNRNKNEIGSDIYFVQNPNAGNKIPIAAFFFCNTFTYDGINLKLTRPN